MALKGALGPFGPYGPRGALLGDLERRNDLLQLIGLIGELSGELGHILRIAQSLFGHLRDLHEVAIHIVQNAGSIAAFKAKRLVCSAISAMICTTLPISLASLLMRTMASET